MDVSSTYIRSGVVCKCSLSKLKAFPLTMHYLKGYNITGRNLSFTAIIKTTNTAQFPFFHCRIGKRILKCSFVLKFY